MRGQVIAVVGIKGGVGKSTIAAHLVGWLVQQGREVGVVDSDSEQALARWLGAALPDVEVISALTSDDVLEIIPELRQRHQVVVCDGPAGDTEATRGLVLMADLAILPVGPSVLDFRGLASTARLVRQARTIRHGKPDAVVVLNRQLPHTVVSREVIAAAPELGLRVADTIIRQRTAIADTAGQCQFTWDLGAAARDSTQELTQLFREVTSGEETRNGLDQGRDQGRHREEQASKQEG